MSTSHRTEQPIPESMEAHKEQLLKLGEAVEASGPALAAFIHEHSGLRAVGGNATIDLEEEAGVVVINIQLVLPIGDDSKSAARDILLTERQELLGDEDTSEDDELFDKLNELLGG